MSAVRVVVAAAAVVAVESIFNASASAIVLQRKILIFSLHIIWYHHFYVYYTFSNQYLLQAFRLSGFQKTCRLRLTGLTGPMSYILGNRVASNNEAILVSDATRSAHLLPFRLALPCTPNNVPDENARIDANYRVSSKKCVDLVSRLFICIGPVSRLSLSLFRRAEKPCLSAKFKLCEMNQVNETRNSSELFERASLVSDAAVAFNVCV